MSAEIAAPTAMRIGEPLLAGRDLIAHLVTSVRREAGPGVSMDVTKTNGLGLDEPICACWKNSRSGPG